MRPANDLLRPLPLALLLTSLGAQADHHVFFNGAPMVTVNTHGEFVQLSLADEQPSGERRVSPAMARAIKRLFAPGDSTARPVRRLILDKGDGCQVPDAVELADGASTDGVLSTRPLKAPWQTGSSEVSAQERQEAMVALQAALKQERTLSPGLRKLLVQNASVTALQLDDSKIPSLVVEAEAEVATQKRGAAVLLVLARNKRGKLEPELADIRAGGASDSEGYGGRWSVVGHADLNGDGQEELFVSEMAYESSRITVYQRQDRRWVPVASGGDSGC